MEPDNWQIKPRSQEALNNTQPKKTTLVRNIQEIILKELLKKKSQIIQTQEIDADTGKPKIVNRFTEQTDLMVCYDAIMEMVKHPDFKIKALGVKFMIDFISKTGEIFYHPIVAAKVDIDKLDLEDCEKEKFIALMQKSNLKVLE